MRPAARRLSGALVLALIALAAFTAGSVLGQAGPRQLRSAASPTAPVPSEAPPTAVLPTPAQLSIKTHLPLLRQSPLFQVLVGTAANPETGEVTAPATEFPSGVLRLYIDARFVGIAGSTYRSEVVFPDGERLTDTNRAAPGNEVYDRYFICRTAAFQCGSGEVALLPGPYTIELFVDDTLVRSDVVVIR